MRQAEREGAAGKPRRRDNTGHRVACAVMGLAAVGLVVAVLLGAPLVSILLAGLLLLCPLLMWVPFEAGRSTTDADDRTAQGPSVG